MTYEMIKYEVNDGIGMIVINRPEVLNALNMQVLAEMLSAVGEASADEAVKVVVLTGAGRSFIAGADIAQMKDFGTVEGLRFGDLGHSVLQALETMDKPVIAAVNGFALGGGTEVSLGCDFIYASAKAKFGQPEVNLGIIPGFGGTQRLPRLIGANAAKELIFTGRYVDAAEAHRIGLVDQVVLPDDVLDSAQELAQRLAAGPPLALRAAKGAIDDGLETDLATGLEIERLQFTGLFATEDQTSGMTSFVEDGPGKATFEGR